MSKKKPSILIPIPYVTFKEDKWVIAHCPLIDVSTQGKTLEEARENIEDLIKHYFKDPDTPKPKIEIRATSISTFNVLVKVKEGVLHSTKTPTLVPT